MNNGIRHFLNKLRICDRTQQQLLINEIIASVDLLSNTDLQVLLEFLTIINDFDLEIKLFSLLAVCIASNDVYYEIVISHIPIYEKLENVLSRGLSLKSTVIFNFIAAMLSNDAEAEALSPRKQLTARARNMLRVSGCLRWLTSFFMNSMVFLDTWKALCQCLAECCRDSPMNKDHCSHLVPLCVKKCLQGITDVLVVLQSLLFEHPKNVQTFLKCQGIEVFRKENLQLNACLQLLCSLVQDPEISAKLRDTVVPRNIAEVLHWSGTDTQKGQWCTIILYYLKLEKEELNQYLFNKSLNSVREAQDHTLTKNIITNEESAQKLHINAVKSMHNSQNDKEKSALHIETKDNDDTVNLLRNVMQEVLYYNTNESHIISSQRIPLHPQRSNFSIFRANEDTGRSQKPGYTFPIEVYNQDSHTVNELSFTFLENTSLKREQKVPTRSQDSKSNYKPENKILDPTAKALHVTSIDNTIDIGEFNPTKTSTPKRDVADALLEQQEYSDTKGKSQLKFSKRSSSCSHTKTTLQKQKIQRAKREFSVKKLADRSMSSKIFEAVNETCTTFVRTVKDIFMPWKKNTTNESNATRKLNTLSFMEYMRKRDAILGCNDKKPEYEFHLSTNTKDINMCSTCNDTKMLKLKLASDEQLKTTLKKLKVGLNLYGCDFKRISKTLWPQETYMTPTELYNLYRKLILK